MIENVVELRPAAADRLRQRELTSAIGMMVALGSWAMMFGAVFFVYVALRAQSLSWPPPGLPPLPLALPSINTAVIVGSSFTLARALSDLRAGGHGASARWMLVTFGLGATFVVLQVLLWRHMLLEGLTPDTGVLGTVFYALTVLHAVHVLAGLGVLGYLLVIALRSVSNPLWGSVSNPLWGPERGAARLEQRVISLRLCGMFWHFVDAVWIVMFVGLFLT